MTREPRRFLRHPAVAMAGAVLCTGMATSSPIAFATSADLAAQERRVAELTRQLEQAKRELAAARKETAEAQTRAEEAEAALERSGAAEASDIELGPLTIGGAIRANYILGSYKGGGDGPSRGGNGGNFELDTFRINAALDWDNVIGKLEYRWYDGYNFIHTGWLGYRLDDASQLEIGVTRKPFGPGPYGISESWFFDQHYYVGLADDPDLGIKYSTKLGDWKLDAAYFVSSEWNGNGRSLDSTRYGYDAIRWRQTVDKNGNVTYGAMDNGFEERNQFNLRVIYDLSDVAVPSELGISLEYGQLKGQRVDNGSHWAASAHMINHIGDWRIASQITRYEYDIDSNNPWSSDELIPMGAYDFAWPVATKAWIPAISISYLKETPSIPWLDSVRPYLEYSNIVKDASDQNDSQLWILGAAWASGGWYIYTDFAYSDGNLFVGNEAANGGTDNYSSVYGVGDFGDDGNNEWNYRFNINFGYYF